MILLEVVLATGLFAMTALIVLAGVHSCFRSLEKMRLESKASDLAVSKVSEVQIGIVPPEDDGPNEYEEDENLAGWTWEIITIDAENEMEMDAPQLLQVQVIVTNVPSGYKYSMQFLTTKPKDDESEENPKDPAGGPAP